MAGPWLLVEWIDERGHLPKYGIVSVSSIIGGSARIKIGKMILVRTGHSDAPRRAQVLKVADSRRDVKEYRNMLERNDRRYREMLTMYMGFMNRQKFGEMGFPVAQEPEFSSYSSSQDGPTHILAQSDSTTDSEPEDEEINSVPQPAQTGHSILRAALQAPILSGSNARSSTYPVPNHATSSGSGQSTRENKFSQKSRRHVQCGTPKQEQKSTQDQGTQTNDQILPNTELLERQVKILYAKFLQLTTHLNMRHEITVDENDVLTAEVGLAENSPIVTDNVMEAENYEVPNVPMEGVQCNGSKLSAVINANVNVSNARVETPPGSIIETKVRRMSAHTTNIEMQADHMVPIGDGNVTVPMRILNDINWGSYTTATRQLLQAVFPRKVLATHSLTGKQSPAFSNKPAKKRLDPDVVRDIVDTVSERCQVPKRLVRNCITIKCTDESKLYRNRQTYRKNVENLPPATSYSSESNGTE